MKLKSISWLKSYHKDKYVQQACKNHLRSRSWFKLADLQISDNLFSSGMIVVDLGSSPGGWSKYVVSQIGNKGIVIACDILPMKPIIGVNFLQGDLSDCKVIRILCNLSNNKKVQVILSDMSPNISGKSIIDVSKSIFLGELTVQISKKILVKNGDLVVKIFQGEGFKKYLCHVRSLFATVKVRKPNSSRAMSREVYVVAKGYK